MGWNKENCCIYLQLIMQMFWKNIHNYERSLKINKKSESVVVFLCLSSPIGSPSARTLWNMTLPWAGTSELVNGGIHFCCWPCVCDTTDFIRVDTKTVEVKDGTFTFNFLVLGNPCQKDSSLIPVYHWHFYQLKNILWGSSTRREMQWRGIGQSNIQW